MKLNEVDTKAGLMKAFQLSKDNEAKRVKQEAFIAGYFAGHSDNEHGRDDEYAAFSDWVKRDKEEVREVMKRPQLSIPPTQKEFEQAFQQLSSMCDSYEVTIKMFKERIEELEATLAMYEGKD